LKKGKVMENGLEISVRTIWGEMVHQEANRDQVAQSAS
jgi:hypothetical protein